jgi:hypothetical protein
MTRTAEVVTSMRTIPNRSVQAQQLEEALRRVEVGQTITYDELSRAIKGNVQGKDRGYLTTARKRLLRQEGMLFEPVINVGLKREGDPGKIDSVSARRERIHRASGRAIKIASTVDLEALAPAQAQQFTLEVACLNATYSISSGSGMKKLGAQPVQSKLPSDIEVPKV